MRRGYTPRYGRWPLDGGALLILAGVTAILAIAASRLHPVPHVALPETVLVAARRAEATMAEGSRVIRQAKEAAGISADPALDPNRTGLIGAELTPLTTTLGNLEAKRTATDPRWAGALVRQVWLAGVRKGDVVAAGFSGSFPGLNLAVVAAAKALGVQLIAISSVTASTFGANQEGFTWPEMEVCLVEAGLLRHGSVGLSPGGEQDAGRGVFPECRSKALAILHRVAPRLGAAVIDEDSLARAITARMNLYARAAGSRPISLYVNVGGTQSSLGTSDQIGRLPNGLLRRLPSSRASEHGVMQRMAERGIPVLHLLDIKGLAVKWGIPLDVRF